MMVRNVLSCRPHLAQQHHPPAALRGFLRMEQPALRCSHHHNRPRYLRSSALCLQTAIWSTGAGSCGRLWQAVQRAQALMESHDRGRAGLARLIAGRIPPCVNQRLLFDIRATGVHGARFFAQIGGIVAFSYSCPWSGSVRTPYQESTGHATPPTGSVHDRGSLKPFQRFGPDSW